MDIGCLKTAISQGMVRITDHADEQAADDALTLNEIYFSVMHGKIIEEYPKDKPYPSCLVMGRNCAAEPVHSVWAFNSENQWAVLITVYRPDPNRWIDWKVRVKR